MSAGSPSSVDVSISVEVEEVAISSDDEVISVRLDEVDQEWASVSDRMLVEERTVTVGWSGREAGSSVPRHAPTPPAGTALPGLRRTPAIVPPPAAGMDVGPLPAPPPPPRQEAAPARKAAPERGRGAPLSNRKKN